MPRLAANLGLLFAERPLLARFGAAAARQTTNGDWRRDEACTTLFPCLAALVNGAGSITLRLGYSPLSCPLHEWAILWFTRLSPFGSLNFHGNRAQQTRNKPSRVEENRKEAACHERAAIAPGNLRLLPVDRTR